MIKTSSMKLACKTKQENKARIFKKMSSNPGAFSFSNKASGNIPNSIG